MLNPISAPNCLPHCLLYLKQQSETVDSVANDWGPRAKILKYNVNVEPNLGPRLFATLSIDNWKKEKIVHTSACNRGCLQLYMLGWHWCLVIVFAVVTTIVALITANTISQTPLANNMLMLIVQGNNLLGNYLPTLCKPEILLRIEMVIVEARQQPFTQTWQYIVNLRDKCEMNWERLREKD